MDALGKEAVMEKELVAVQYACPHCGLATHFVCPVCDMGVEARNGKLVKHYPRIRPSEPPCEGSGLPVRRKLRNAPMAKW